jgi:hypothetical protein
VATAALVLGDFIAPLNFNGFRMLPACGQRSSQRIWTDHGRRRRVGRRLTEALATDW